MRLPWREVDEAGRTILTSVTEHERDLLRQLAERRFVLEIGSAYGYSALVMARTARHVLGLDPHEAIPGSLTQMRDNLQASDVGDRVAIILGDSRAMMPRLYQLGARFGLVFVDGDHEEASVLHDITWAFRLLRTGGFVAAHDYGEDTCPGVGVALDEFAEPDYVADTLWVKKGGPPW